MNPIREALGFGRAGGLPAGESGGKSRWLVVGLGNPGAEYAETRHNVGFWCVDLLAKQHSIGLNKKQRFALVGVGDIAGCEAVLAKPKTYMNNSGQAVTSLVSQYRVKPANILVVYDEMSLPTGKIRVRPGGSSAGHNGIKSIIAALGTEEFPRIRIGIGQPEGGGNIHHVLGRMPAEERKVADEAVLRAIEAVESILSEGIDKAMNKYN
ncbi:MAG: aminoacyl-tRNA hydrolase [SAR202 cluster bacterium]|nr:aminoacyl-tRNA hydrolase [SAR202 cluster bacterium]